ncbi:MAG: MATE family efflux transporter [Dysosmobacter welbionis]
MGCMITGAVLNLILDPVFIFPLGMGVVGAGIATVIGQVAAGVLFLAYLPRLHTVRLRRQALRPTIRLTGRILALGVPSLLTQILTALVQITLNNLLRVHGAASVYGSDIALSVYGMMMKVYQIAHSMFVGVSSAVQPINGYNFGAKHFLRVRQTFRTAAAIALVISGCGSSCSSCFPGRSGCCSSLTTPLPGLCPALLPAVYGRLLPVRPASGHRLFLSRDRPAGTLLAIPLARQGVFLIPLAILLSGRFGLDGALLAAPISDVLTFLLSLLLVRREFAVWRQRDWIET